MHIMITSTSAVLPSLNVATCTRHTDDEDRNDGDDDEDDDDDDDDGGPPICGMDTHGMCHRCPK